MNFPSVKCYYESEWEDCDGDALVRSKGKRKKTAITHFGRVTLHIKFNVRQPLN